MSLGQFTEAWALAEFALDLAIAALFHKHGGNKVDKRIPRGLEPRISFLRRVSATPQMAPFPAIADIAQRFADAAEERNTLIHGVAIELAEHSGEATMLKVLYEPRTHRDTKSVTNPAKMAVARSAALALAHDTLTLAYALATTPPPKDGAN